MRWFVFHVQRVRAEVVYIFWMHSSIFRDEFVGKSSAVNVNAGDGIYTFEVISPPSQIQALNESVFYVLDNTLDQNQLIQQMNRLDIARRGSIIWNDLNKFAPYLKSGDIKSAENVLKSILMQHSCLANGSDFNSLFLLSAESLGSMGVEDRALIQRLNWLKMPIGSQSMIICVVIKSAIMVLHVFVFCRNDVSMQ